MTDTKTPDAIIWDNDGLRLLDQRILPSRVEYLALGDARETADAIRDMVVRGAPAIGITASYGVVLAARNALAAGADDLARAVESDLALLAASRPTAVNLFWALDRMKSVLVNPAFSGQGLVDRLGVEAERIHQEDIAANRSMGDFGAGLISAPCGVLTHCNAGALATGGYGTALGVVRSAYAQGKVTHVYADETRPWMQGARLTAWEMVQEGIPVSLEADGAAAWLMKQGRVSWVIVGSDRIAANGDVANKIGTYGLAILARHHGVRFMVAAPTSTVDMDMSSGDGIPIETRAEEEVLGVFGTRYGPEGAGAWNPVFDVTPADLVDAIVTERGVVERPNRERMARMMAG
ncbi:MAG: S-methyl-5-thioribose-1-phosphate isomerase [Gammaproteobacteria bacterium]